MMPDFRCFRHYAFADIFADASAITPRFSTPLSLRHYTIITTADAIFIIFADIALITAAITPLRRCFHFISIFRHYFRH
jgi:hypothetical protein